MLIYLRLYKNEWFGCFPRAAVLANALVFSLVFQIWPTFISHTMWNSLLTLSYEFLLVICLGFSSESEYFFAIFYPKVFKLLSQGYLWRISSIQGRVIWIGYWLTGFWEYQGIDKFNHLTVSLNVLNWDAEVIAVANSQVGQVVSLKTCQVVRCT